MIVLDSGAEASVINEIETIPFPTNIPLNLISFNSNESVCNQTGEMIVNISDTAGHFHQVNLGWSGCKDGVTRDNLGSVPTMIQLGWQFWFGNHPYCVSPTGVEFPLYVSSTGYLALRMVTIQPKQVNSNTIQEPLTNAKNVGYLSNDFDLWHSRFCHQPRALIEKMIKRALDPLGKNLFV